MARKDAASKQTPVRPRNWATAVHAAYLRAVGHSQKHAAEAAGMSPRTLRTWERAEWWQDAQREASGRWLERLTSAARRTLLTAVREGDAERALRILERTMPELAPPAIRATVASIDYSTLTDDELARIASGEDPATVLGARKHGRTR